MFEIGFSEILVISAIALLVLGPEKLPKIAAQVGRWTGRARAMAKQLRTQLEQEANLQEALRAAQQPLKPRASSPKPAYEPPPEPAATATADTPPVEPPHAAEPPHSSLSS
jgi:sec-independent protein translocase protein TatB